MPSFKLGLLGSSSSQHRDRRRAYISPDALKASKLAAGEWVELRSQGTSLKVVQLWPRVGLSDSELLSSVLAPLEEDVIVDEVVPIRSFSHISTLSSILVERDGEQPLENERETKWLKSALKEHFVDMKYVRLGSSVVVNKVPYSLKDVQVRPPKSKTSLEAGLEKLKLGDEGSYFEVDWKTEIVLLDSKNTRLKSSQTSNLPSYINLYVPSASSSAGYDSLGGLRPQISLVQSLIDLPLLHSDLCAKFKLKPPRGILLHGPPGTGKTALARAIAGSRTDCSCIVVNGPELSSAYHGETEERLRGIFTEAQARSPCIIVLDEIDALCPRRDGDGGEVEKRVVATLLTLMDGMDGDSGGVFVIGATNRPNSIDPSLRRPGRFDREVELGIPDASSRREILEIFLKTIPHSISPDQTTSLAARTHGYVGADLSYLIREATYAAIERSDGSTETMLQFDDILTVFKTMRPSTMREVFVETPDVRWTDIGGQEMVKQKLRECVAWPLSHRDTFLRLGVEAPKGVLLYGPPGCSKTMIAKALATESGINFLAIKGPELLNKFVGESERAVREVFRKARAASPSIIFFDEIDALGTARSDDMVHSGVLTSLLNEMDGIEELTGVVIVAATNRPDVLDSALLRPGRLDRILYVGPPDKATRKEIFRIRLAKMAIEPGVYITELAELTDGCSGAEIASICQDAALAAMNEDLEAPYVKRSHFVDAARTVRRRITPSMIQDLEQWRDQSGVRSA